MPHTEFLVCGGGAREEFVNDQQHLGLSATYRVRHQNDIRICMKLIDLRGGGGFFVLHQFEINLS